jgi:hypothetical protein
LGEHFHRVRLQLMAVPGATGAALVSAIVTG